MALSLEGKTAVITGSSRGIGKAIALALAADGCDIVVAARTEQPLSDLPGTVNETVEAIRALGRRAIGVRCDVTRDEDLEALVDQAYREFGKVDILVNNAGGGAVGAFLTSDVSSLDNTFRINIHASFLLSQLVANRMVASGGGAIINISSGAANLPTPPAPATTPARPQTGGALSVSYGMAKAAMDRFGAGIARELWEHKIAVININPGFTITERLALRMSPEEQSRGERPETTGKAVAFLCRDPMAYTGRILVSRTVVNENGL